MSIKRYVANKDTTITNAFKSNLRTRATQANMGESDTLEVFSLYGQSSTTSSENSRILLDFPISKISEDRSNLSIPKSGSVQFMLKLSNAEHPYTTPRKFNISVFPLSSSWEEGNGLDMEDYSDSDTVNWLSSSITSSWVNEGSDYIDTTEFTQYFERGNEDLEIDVTSVVEQWLTGTLPANGFLVKLPDSLENEARSYFTKKFFARGSQFFFKRPIIEARFDDSIKDDRNDFYKSSSLSPPEDNINRLYLYNRHRGLLSDIGGNLTSSLYCSVYSGSLGPSGLPIDLSNTPLSAAFIEATRIRKGVYEAQLVVDTSAPYLFDVWHNGDNIYYYTGSAFDVKNGDGDNESDFQITDYTINITNLKTSYSTSEQARFNLYIRDRNWDPTIFTVAKANAENFTIRKAYYKVFRIIDNLTVIPYGDGPIDFTRLSYDDTGNYFDLDMSLFEPSYTYGIKFMFKEFGLETEQREVFKFRVEE
jgi:hypothetical protein